jgi:hypothetical protein
MFAREEKFSSTQKKKFARHEKIGTTPKKLFYCVFHKIPYLCERRD